MGSLLCHLVIVSDLIKRATGTPWSYAQFLSIYEHFGTSLDFHTWCESRCLSRHHKYHIVFES